MSNGLRSSKITFRDAEAGRLEETAAGGTRFIYHDAWTETIACCLPVSRREQEWAQGLHPFFQQLGAEGWLRERQARTAHVSEEDDFGLLLRFGADCIGAVGVRPEGELPPLSGLREEATNPGRTVSGVQRKLLVTRDEASNGFRPAAGMGPAPYIAKFNSEDVPTLVRNEHLSLRWTAAVLGADEVTAFELGEVTEANEVALVVKRFDRTPDGAKLRAEDFAQILCKPRGLNYRGKYEASYENVAEVIRAHSARPDIDIARFFRRLVLFSVIANCDAHLKNFTLLERPEGLRLSPVYDVVNVGIYPRFDQNLALSIGGVIRPAELVRRPLLSAFGQSIGLSKRAVDQIFEELKSKARQAAKVLPATARDEPGEFLSNFSEVVRSGCARILEE